MPEAKSDKDVRRLWNYLARGMSLVVAARNAGMSLPTARKYRRCGNMPSEIKPQRNWRTRKNPFGKVWPEIEALIRDIGQPLLSTIKLFDVYTGEHVTEGKRSLAYSITYQAEDRTLTDEDVTQVHEKIQQGLKEKLNAEIRGLDA